MKIRRDSVFISSVLFTIAFLSCIPPILGTALTGRHPNPALDPNLAEATRLIGDLGVASLAILFIGLTVTWTGYVKRVRWTWFVMFIIVWIWAFPLMILPQLQHPMVPTLAEWLSNALKQPGDPRDSVEEILVFLLMVIALILPMKSFLLGGKPPEPVVDHRP